MSDCVQEGVNQGGGAPHSGLVSLSSGIRMIKYMEKLVAAHRFFTYACLAKTEIGTCIYTKLNI